MLVVGLDVQFVCDKAVVVELVRGVEPSCAATAALVLPSFVGRVLMDVKFLLRCTFVVVVVVVGTVLLLTQ